MHVIPGLGVGGAERTLAALVTASREQPVSQVVVDLMGNTTDGTQLADAIRAANVPVYHLGGRSLRDLPVVLAKLAMLIRKLRPVAIQSWLYYADLASLWALDLSGRRSSTRLYWGIRSSDLDQSHYRRALAWTIRQCAKRSNRPDAIVANSLAGRALHEALGYRPDALCVIPNGIDTERFRPDPEARARMRAAMGVAADKVLIIHAARVDPMKDHASFVAVADALPNFQFVMAGAGTEKINAPSNVMAIGVNHDMASLYAAADLMVSTSLFGEGFPNVVAEAMACSVPVVATDVGDSRRVVGDTGVIVEPGDVVGIISAIDEILKPSPQREFSKIAARRRIEDNFSLARMVRKFDALHFNGELPAFDPADTIPAALSE